MANKTLFANSRASKVPATDTINAAGGRAYSKSAKSALAQIACTNCFNGTYYVDASANLEIAKQAVAALRNDPEFIAKVAVYSRSKSYMKDMPAFLTAYLATLDSKLFRKVFPKVIDNGKMLRNFVQIARSGQLDGKKLNMSAGACRHAIRDWFNSRSSGSIFHASIGNNPTLAEILRMARPRPENEEKATLYAYLKDAPFEDGHFISRDKEGNVRFRHSYDSLPEIVRQYENFKKTHEGAIPNVDFRMLDSVLTKDELRKLWAKEAVEGAWQKTRMNLNNFQKYGVFDDKALVKTVADRLANREEVQSARAYPYQLLMAYHAAENVPFEVREALQDAMTHALENTPPIKGKVYVCVDTSGSMGSPITGTRFGGHSSKVSCVDVAALFAAAVLSKNRDAEIWTFNSSAVQVKLNPRDSIMTNAGKLNRAGGGTDCSAALRGLNANKAKGDAVIYVSDYESWIDSGYNYSYYGTGMLTEWQTFKGRNKNSKLVCIDLTPRTNSQVTNHKDVLCVGGFGDAVFDVVASFVEHGQADDHWVDVIEKTEI